MALLLKETWHLRHPMHPRHPVVANYPTEIEHLDNFSKVQSLVLFFVENTVASWFFENLLLQGWGCRGCSAPLRLSITTIWLLFLMLAGVCVLVYDAFTCVTWLITWRIDMCDMTHYMTHWYVWHDSLHDSLTCVAWLIAWLAWLIDMCGMTCISWLITWLTTTII